jgi:hypothetical protein
MFTHHKTFQAAPVEVPYGLEAVYANHVLVRFSATTFMLDFVQVLPGVRLHRVRSRVSLLPQDAYLLSQAIDGCPDSGESWSSGRARLRGGEPAGSDTDAPGPLPMLPYYPAPDRSEPRSNAPARSTRPHIVVPADLRASPCNFVMLATSRDEVVLDFVHLLPNHFDFTVSARVVLPPGTLRMLAEALEEALSQFSAKHGPVSSPESEEWASNLRRPAAWGLSMPFAIN